MQRTFGIAFVFFASQALALDASDFSDLEGWTIVAVTQIEGDFEGCTMGRHLNYTNGMHTICADETVSISVSPDAVIFTKRFGDRVFVRVLIDDEFFDMRPVKARK